MHIPPPLTFVVLTKQDSLLCAMCAVLCALRRIIYLKNPPRCVIVPNLTTRGFYLATMRNHAKWFLAIYQSSTGAHIELRVPMSLCVYLWVLYLFVLVILIAFCAFISLISIAFDCIGSIIPHYKKPNCISASEKPCECLKEQKPTKTHKSCYNSNDVTSRRVFHEMINNNK